jgi:hypothetical protein
LYIVYFQLHEEEGEAGRIKDLAQADPQSPEVRNGNKEARAAVAVVVAFNFSSSKHALYIPKLI